MRGSKIIILQLGYWRWPKQLWEKWRVAALKLPGRMSKKNKNTTQGNMIALMSRNIMDIRDITPCLQDMFKVRIAKL